ncbi:TIGR02680 family protein [Nocardia cyriacigeorgica]|uniref:TIGR02680 family protein n=3 Tax=Nocardia TaxID=1817 RepID=A0A6P1D1A1_9NOCA|nr:TIGR02680 family protein [Nocardia cyriacigeorgica]NEW36375.1 TIGR02680 family protein [Nocardia cyriacigeorgica]
MTVTQLPQHQSGTDRHPRWLPTRAGILNVWRYYDEIFEFHHGRLLLRGPNGSGKSKALELLLPFLFDASLRSNRLSTFGTGERTMHWNLMGEGASGTTRVGYVWLEFCLPGSPDRWFTCGARLQATTRTTSVHADYFTTGLRICAPESSSVSLTESNRPLTRAGLADRLGDAGVVHDNATDYRDAVRSTLFPTLNDDRYDALITALLQLRTPKLSQRLDPALLSTLLSRALPPLSKEEIADLAEGFERLDAQRERLARLDEEVAATRKLARQQQVYAQRVLRARAAALISATSELDRLSEKARVSAAEYDRVDALNRDTQARVNRSASELGTTEAALEGLMKLPAYQKGLELDDLRKSAERARERAASAERRAAELHLRAERDAARSAESAGTVRSWQRVADNAAIDARHAAGRAGLASVFDELEQHSGASRARALLRAAVRSRLDQIDDLRDLLTRHHNAITRRTDAESDLDAARAGLVDAETAHSQAQRTFDQAVSELREAVRSWAGSCGALVFDDVDGLVDLAADRPALVEQVNAAASMAGQEITRRETHCRHEIASVRHERDDRIAQRDRLAAEQDIAPEPPAWRTADRRQMSGAPLWQLVEFADGLTPDAEAGVEAALESAGFLDAWVGTDGVLTGHDLFADPRALPPVPGRSLTDVLRPLPDAGVLAELVHRLLSSIAFGDELAPDAVAAVSADGRWRLANLTGSWSKDQPSFIGATTRARVREHRIRMLNAEITELGHRLDALDSELARCAAQRQLIESERTGLPSSDAVIAAETACTRAESELHAADRLVRERVTTVSTREQEARRAQHALAARAAESGLPADPAALRVISQATADFDGQTGTWLDTMVELRSARGTAGQAADRAAQSAADASVAADAAATAAEEFQVLTAELMTIENSIGQEYRHVIEQIAQTRQHAAALAEGLETDRADLTEFARVLGRLESQQEADIAARDAAIAYRDELAAKFRQLAVGTFPDDGRLPDLPKFRATLAASDGVRAALDAARMVSAAWPTIPHSPTNLSEALRRLADSVHECRSALSARADLDLESDDDIQVFTAVVDGVRVGCAELLRAIETEAEQSKQEITDQERRLFDHTLTGDTRRHLAARIRQANELVDGMNTRLERVRTASNVAVKLVWQVRKDLPSGTKAARDLLLRDPTRLDDDDRESLHRFLRDRIEEAKADDTASSWEQQLAQVFDYTAWHQFVVKIDRGKGEDFQELTKKLHGALSGGEKAIALHLPLFAAVAAHYQAAPQAPRMIMLDEVFVGVDTANRGQIFALLSALDLDLVLTSDHEWCTYAELSGIGIHQIVSGDGSDAVTTARFMWNGSELTTA